MKQVRVLLVEDDVDGRASVTDVLEDAGCTVIAVENGTDGVAAMNENRVDVVLTDLVMPGLDGLGVLEAARTDHEGLPVLLMTAHGSVDTAVKALREGAYDYIQKPLDIDDIVTKVMRAAEAGQLRSEVKDLRQTIGQSFGIEAMIADSGAMNEVIRQLKAVMDTDATVMVLGESGTGKELIARALHVDGARREGPFVAVNCGALSESLLESELFGHEKGAFTGATERRAGAFERAHGGTLFLDEIGTAPQAVQTRLLRVLEDREVMRIGGQESVAVNVRIVAATNEDLEHAVREGVFRQDLLYRLKVVTISLPPLRERTEDIRLMADRFLEEACRSHARQIQTVDESFYEGLSHYSWPGNIRQLKNVVESAVILARSTTLDSADLQLDSSGVAPLTSLPADMTLADIEKVAIQNALQRNEGNRTLAAKELGVSVRTIQRKIQEFDLPF